MSVVATHDLGKRGVRTSAPAVFAWRWYYHLWSLGFWSLVLVPLVMIRENRRLGAWTILLALAAILLGSHMIATLLMLGPATAERFRLYFGTLATGWTIVWLLGPWFSRMRGWLVLLVSTAVMVGIQIVAYVGTWGFTCDDSLTGWATIHVLPIFWLLLPMALSRRSCRKTYSAGRFMAWLFLWTLVVTYATLIVLCGINLWRISHVPDAISPGRVFSEILFVIIGGAVAGLLFYVFHLPFMLVALRTRFYRRRFRRVFGFGRGVRAKARVERLSPGRAEG